MREANELNVKSGHRDEDMEYRTAKRGPRRRAAGFLPLPARPLPLCFAAALLSVFVLLLRGCAIAREGGGEAPAPSGEAAAAVIAVYDDGEGRVISMPLEEYLCGVVAAEMPASFEAEALKAQAVAARTFTLRRLSACGGTPCGRGGADICTDSACCQSYRSAEQLREKWGGSAAYYSARVEDAVYATAGEVATYGGALIEALYHSTAGGMTENAENVFASAAPYLVSVASPGEEGSAHYAESTAFPRRAFIEKINAAFPKAGLSEKKLEGQVEITARFASGRVKSIRLGQVETTGRLFRKALDLPSANFTIEFVGEDVRVSTKGYGHGVGMSQYGANAMAEAGSGYRAILTHYYTGVEIEDWSARLEPVSKSIKE